MRALCIVLLMIVISADNLGDSGYGQVFFYNVVHNLYVQ